jgi:hypothetical protein
VRPGGDRVFQVEVQTPVLCAGRALMDFSFHMATGNMDEAYKAVKLVANPSVWANM